MIGRKIDWSEIFDQSLNQSLRTKKYQPSIDAVSNGIEGKMKTDYQT